MIVDGGHVEEIKDLLSKQFKEGHKWVAFSDYNPQLVTGDLKCFKDFDSLEKHCQDEFEFYKPISNVLKSLDPGRHELSKAYNPELLRNGISKFPIEPVKSIENMITHLEKGEIYPVTINRAVNREAEIHKYNIFEHTHPGHQAYEIGHEISLLNHFENLKEALEHWNHLAETYPNLPDRQKTDLILIAEFKNQKPQLDLEGLPMRNSAILLKTAYPNYNVDEGKRIYQFNDWQDLNALIIKQPAFAKFNTQNNQLEFFNSKLAKVDPQDRINYFDINFFSTKEVVISNSINEALKFNPSAEESLPLQKNNQKINRAL